VITTCQTACHSGRASVVVVADKRDILHAAKRVQLRRLLAASRMMNRMPLIQWTLVTCLQPLSLDDCVS
jgi:hypothetical protein